MNPPSTTSVTIIVLIVSYLLGCFSTGFYLTRLQTGQDLRQLGSGSTGARNVSRTLGKPGFVLTLLGDALKGAIAMGLARYFGLGPWGVALVLLAVVGGHIFPIQLNFDGGKGLGTVMGAMLLLDYRLVLLVALITGFLGAISKQITLSLMIVLAFTPVAAYLLGHAWPTIFGIIATALLIIAAHRPNIQRALEQIKERANDSKKG